VTPVDSQFYGGTYVHFSDISPARCHFLRQFFFCEMFLFIIFILGVRTLVRSFGVTTVTERNPVSIVDFDPRGDYSS
jgi:hypothetical protein